MIKISENDDVIGVCMDNVFKAVFERRPNAGGRGGRMDAGQTPEARSAETHGLLGAGFPCYSFLGPIYITSFVMRPSGSL
jgi:hypothetical protein